MLRYYHWDTQSLCSSFSRSGFLRRLSLPLISLLVVSEALGLGIFDLALLLIWEVALEGDLDALFLCLSDLT